jgi:putative transposase
VSHTRQEYASDISDEQWAILKPLLPLEQDGPGRPLELNMREVVNAIFYVNRTGCQWENLPHDFPDHNSVYYHYNKWCKDGTWETVNDALREQERRKRGREPEPNAVVIDSQSVKTTEAGGPSGYDAAKKVNGRKRHVVVDTIGNILDVTVSAADMQDRDGAKQLLADLKTTLAEQLEVLWADGAYRGGLIDWVRDQLNIDCTEKRGMVK